MPDTVLIGVDLGQAADYTAVTHTRWWRDKVARINPSWDDRWRAGDMRPTRSANRYELLSIWRERRIPYDRVVSAITKMTRQVEEQHKAQWRLIMDATGVGRPIYDLLVKERLRPVAITLTGGTQAGTNDIGYTVPKRDVIVALQVASQSGRLRYAGNIAYKRQLQDELQNMHMKINIRTGHDSYEAWREQEHDDIVLAEALPIWYAEAGSAPQVSATERVA